MILERKYMRKEWTLKNFVALVKFCKTKSHVNTEPYMFCLST